MLRSTRGTKSYNFAFPKPLNPKPLSADLGGRVGWLPKAEKVKPSSFLPYRARQGAPGPKPPGDLAQRPLGPGSPSFLTCCGANHAWGRWMVSEGGALQSRERRVPVFAPAFQPQAPEDLANKPLNPASRQPSRVKNSKNAPVLIGS